MAARFFSTYQLARLIEELQWSFSSTPTTRKLRSPNRTASTLNRNPQAKIKHFKRDLLERLPSGEGIAERLDFSDRRSPLVSKRRLSRFIPLAGLGAAIATMDSSLVTAVLIGSGCGWCLWLNQTKGNLLADALSEQLSRLNVRPEHRQLGMTIAAGGAMAIASYGGLALWENFHNGWLVAGVVGQSGLTMAMALMLLQREGSRQQEEQVTRFYRLLDQLSIAVPQQRPILVRQLFWLAMNGRLDAYQQGMVLQVLQSLFVNVEDGAQKSQLSEAIAQFQQIQERLHSNPVAAHKSPRALSGSKLEQVHTPLGNQTHRRPKRIAQTVRHDDFSRQVKQTPINLTKGMRNSESPSE